MLPKDPVIRSRLLRSARLLLDWSQARLACEVGVSTSIIYAVESGRLSGESPAAQAVEQALERGGVQIIPAADPVGPGLRYTSEQIRPAESVPQPNSRTPIRRSSQRTVLSEPELGGDQRVADRHDGIAEAAASVHADAPREPPPLPSAPARISPRRAAAAPDSGGLTRRRSGPERRPLILALLPPRPSQCCRREQVHLRADSSPAKVASPGGVCHCYALTRRRADCGPSRQEEGAGWRPSLQIVGGNITRQGPLSPIGRSGPKGERGDGFDQRLRSCRDNRCEHGSDVRLVRRPVRGTPDKRACRRR